ncbi:MAG: bifunctional ADP-dependent NAD(P)H-hydrate dehydratase/NAD(P)H-hydrate epimerase, partial [Candidatus Eremiobacteraeota bacterium]|nr:bifunctional ADP-dependent NAD(P)H-hydrate dehydratase/NAD(P)H-hydrate epimerase [Candidatus Eremiobacteraeota bacterium]
MIVLDAPGMRALDAHQVAERGEVRLMHDAGEAIAALIPTYTRGKTIAGVAGPGNNGGDVFAALASLPSTFERIAYALPAPNPSAARADAVARAKARGVEERPIASAADLAGLSNADLILDGVLGVGSRLPLAAPLDGIAAGINAAGPPILAIDLPSGLDAS